MHNSCVPYVPVWSWTVSSAFLAKFYSGYQIKKSETDGQVERMVMGFMQGFDGETWGTETTWGPKRGWDDNINL
jgi:hypothetical protein